MKCKIHHANKFLFPHLPIFFLEKFFQTFQIFTSCISAYFYISCKNYFEEVPVEHAGFLKILTSSVMLTSLNIYF